MEEVRMERGRDGVDYPVTDVFDMTEHVGVLTAGSLESTLYTRAWALLMVVLALVAVAVSPVAVILAWRLL